jgi:hypothetical protein
MGRDRNIYYGMSAESQNCEAKRQALQGNGSVKSSPLLGSVSEAVTWSLQQSRKHK